MIGLIMIAAFVAWLLYCFVFNCGGNCVEDADLHYAIPDLDDETAPLNPAAARDIAAVLDSVEATEGQRAVERS